MTVTGAAGVGKTRLVEELRAHLAAAGDRVIPVRLDDLPAGAGADAIAGEAGMSLARGAGAGLHGRADPRRARRLRPRARRRGGPRPAVLRGHRRRRRAHDEPPAPRRGGRASGGARPARRPDRRRPRSGGRARGRALPRAGHRQRRPVGPIRAHGAGGRRALPGGRRPAAGHRAGGGAGPHAVADRAPRARDPADRHPPPAGRGPLGRAAGHRRVHRAVGPACSTTTSARSSGGSGSSPAPSTSGSCTPSPARSSTTTSARWSWWARWSTGRSSSPSRRPTSTRYRMLQVVREHALADLTAAGLADETRERLASAMVAEATDILVEGSQRWSGELIERITTRAASFIASLEWCIAHDDDPEPRLRPLRPAVRARPAEGRRRAGDRLRPVRALAGDPGAPPRRSPGGERHRPRALGYDLDAAQALAEAAHRRPRRHPDRHRAGRAGAHPGRHRPGRRRPPPSSTPGAGERRPRPSRCRPSNGSCAASRPPSSTAPVTPPRRPPSPDEAIADSRAADDPLTEIWARLVAVTIDIRDGRVEEAGQQLDLAQRRAAAIDDAWWGGPLARSRALLAAHLPSERRLASVPSAVAQRHRAVRPPRRPGGAHPHPLHRGRGRRGARPRRRGRRLAARLAAPARPHRAAGGVRPPRAPPAPGPRRLAGAGARRPARRSPS